MPLLKIIQCKNKLNEIIAQSFNNWNNDIPKKRKDTEIDFAKQLYPTMNKSLADNVKSIMSPDYKMRSMSINSSGWNMHKPSFDYRAARFSIGNISEAKEESIFKFNQGEFRRMSNFQRGESKNEILNILKNTKDFKITNERKSTMIDPPVKTLKQSSPLNFPNNSAAFKPFKKRAQSFHISPRSTNLVNDNDRNGFERDSEVNNNGVMRKRDLKAELKTGD